MNWIVKDEQNNLSQVLFFLKIELNGNETYHVALLDPLAKVEVHSDLVNANKTEMSYDMFDKCQGTVVFAKIDRTPPSKLTMVPIDGLRPMEAHKSTLVYLDAKHRNKDGDYQTKLDIVAQNIFAYNVPGCGNFNYG
jgi:hypothetical protein